MKKLILTAALLAGVTAGALAQGTVYVDTINNATAGTGATSGGLIYVKTGTAAPILQQGDVSFTLLAGTSSSSLTLITSGTGAAEVGDSDLGGKFTDNNGVAYSLAAGGVGPNATAWLELEVWSGTTLSSYAAALTAADPAGFAIFQNPTGALGNPAPAPGLSGMPAIVMTVPEPGTMVLGGLGAAALLLFRRKK